MSAPHGTSVSAPVSPPRRDLGGAPFLDAVHGRRPSRLPVWFMRQAGRSLPEYRALRAGSGMLEACLTPDNYVIKTIKIYGSLHFSLLAYV